MKKYIIILCMSAILAIFGLVTLFDKGTSSHAVEYIGAEQAKAIAISSGNVGDKTVTGLNIDLDKKGNLEYYDVDYRVNGLEYSFDIDAFTGAVIASEIPAGSEPKLTATPQINPEPTLVPEKKQITDTTTSPTTAPDTTTSPTTAPGINTEPVLQADSGNMISEAQAKQSVLSRIPGATEANFVKFKLEMDDGKYEYEGEVVYGDAEYEFEIDAYSGAFRDWSVESVYDD